MARCLVVGNGQLLVNFDEGLNMRDLYYPRVGQLNHIGGHKNSFGIWAEGRFQWCDEPSWKRRLAYRNECLVTDVTADNALLGIKVSINDAVHHLDNIYIKKMVVENLLDQPREVRVFFTHDFSIDENEVGDTALYDPGLGAVYHYKRNRYVLINGRSSTEGIYQFAMGIKRFLGAEGTWRDAEDGELSGNPIAQGSVDSTVSFRMQLPAGGKETLFYWIVIGKNYQEIRSLNNYVMERSPEVLIRNIETYWRLWCNKGRTDFADLPTEIISLYKRSLLVIRTHIDHGGAIVASTDSDIMQYNRDHYNYVWPRDGALVAYALVLANYPELATGFFYFCENALTEGGFLLHKYNPDGTAGSSWHPWYHQGIMQLPIQEDETALVLFALWQYYLKVKDVEFIYEIYRTLVEPAGDFLASFFLPELSLPEPSYDLWEERRGVFTFTCCAVYSGLQAAGAFAEIFGIEEKAAFYRSRAEDIKKGILLHLYDDRLGRFVRGIYLEGGGSAYRRDLTLESSMAALFELGVMEADDPRIVATMQAVENGLWVKSGLGGVARYAGDKYCAQAKDQNIPGNPWIISTLWLANWYTDIARKPEDLQRSLELLLWVSRRAKESGILPEQVHPLTGEMLSVAPLTWSHSTFILAVIRYIDRYKRLCAINHP
ncbi:MAG: glycoside hydrolase family 15 protein [Bacillota bacterium]